jgi:hypothetical protein
MTDSTARNPRNGAGLSATPVAGKRRIDCQPRRLDVLGTRFQKGGRGVGMDPSSQTLEARKT